MTQDQRYHRRLARKYGSFAASVVFTRMMQDDPDYRGIGSPYALARKAAWHAFHAHPELRGSGAHTHSEHDQ